MKRRTSVRIRGGGGRSGEDGVRKERGRSGE